MPTSPPDRTGLDIPSHGVRLSAWRFRAATDAWETAAGRPCVVMAHGFGATRDSGLLPFAERFAEAGTDVLLFDYRGFGTSEGTPRQHVSHRRHRQDYHAAIAYARNLDGVDPERIVAWGSSYSGGHVVAVAAADPRVAAVISQGAAMDGFGSLAGDRPVRRCRPGAQADRARSARRGRRARGQAAAPGAARRRAGHARRHHLPRRSRRLLPDHGPHASRTGCSRAASSRSCSTARSPRRPGCGCRCSISGQASRHSPFSITSR